MKFLTNKECIDWCKNYNLPLNSEFMPEIVKDNAEIIEFPYPIYTGFLSLASIFSSHILLDRECLLWIRQTNIWKSSENLHLYYKLRQSYSDFTLLEDKPGHLFLKHESEDFKSFLHLSLLFGWDCYLLSTYDFVRIFCSHDEFIKLSATDSELIQIINKHFVDK